VQDIDDEPNYLARAVDRARLPNETVSFIALPLRSDGELLGLLGVHRIRGRTRALADDLRILEIIATLITQVLKLNDRVAAQTARLEHENRELKWALERGAPQQATLGIVGEAPALRHALRQIEQVSSTDVTVLLLGESGTGKELFARALHLSSPRRDQPFVKVNCGAIPENLFESELFGYEKGAFTGAVTARAGYFEQANGGTLFLDEIGELPLSMQVKLLRVLQEKKVRKVGATAEEPIDVRIVSATHQDLSALVETGRFRQDLYYRLNVIDLVMPSLRDRAKDIPEMARFLLDKLGGADVELDRDAEKALCAYAFPGNVRELENTLERALALCEGRHINAADLNLVPALPAAGAAPGSKYPLQDYLDQMERAAILEALEQTRYNKTAAARLLGVTFRSLRYRLERLRIE
jgi:two-component system response regulator PilR (NtrC family)